MIHLITTTLLLASTLALPAIPPTIPTAKNHLHHRVSSYTDNNVNHTAQQESSMDLASKHHSQQDDPDPLLKTLPIPFALNQSGHHHHNASTSRSSNPEHKTPDADTTLKSLPIPLTLNQFSPQPQDGPKLAPESLPEVFPIPLALNQPRATPSQNDHPTPSNGSLLSELLALEEAESTHKPSNTSTPLTPRSPQSSDPDPNPPANLTITTYTLPSCSGKGATTSVFYHEYVPGQIASYHIDRDLTADEELDFFTYAPGNLEDACRLFVGIGEFAGASGGKTQAIPAGCYSLSSVASCLEVWRYDEGVEGEDGE